MNLTDVPAMMTMMKDVVQQVDRVVRGQGSSSVDRAERGQGPCSVDRMGHEQTSSSRPFQFMPCDDREQHEPAPTLKLDVEIGSVSALSSPRSPPDAKYAGEKVIIIVLWANSSCSAMFVLAERLVSNNLHYYW